RGGAGQEHLEGDGPAEGVVVGEVDDHHPAAAEFAFDGKPGPGAGTSLRPGGRSDSMAVVRGAPHGGDTTESGRAGTSGAIREHDLMMPGPPAKTYDDLLPMVKLE